jgi:hypothetical protein
MVGYAFGKLYEQLTEGLAIVVGGLDLPVNGSR